MQPLNGKEIDNDLLDIVQDDPTSGCEIPWLVKSMKVVAIALYDTRKNQRWIFFFLWSIIAILVSLLVAVLNKIK